MLARTTQIYDPMGSYPFSGRNSVKSKTNKLSKLSTISNQLEMHITHNMSLGQVRGGTKIHELF